MIKRRDEIDDHFKDCWANKCNGSHTHPIGQCGLQIVECPNNGCNVELRRYKLDNHQTKQCLFGNKTKSKRVLVLTQAQRDRIKQNKERALQRKSRLNAKSHSQTNLSSNTCALSEEVRRRIEQNKQRALQLRRASMNR